MNDIVKIFGDARIAFRSDTLENWQKENPVLLSGEFSVVTDGTETEKVKIGDGKTPWNDLPWWKGPEGKQGPQGEKGEQGFRGVDGNDGTPATHSWNGTTLTITSASGTSSANLKGEKGDKGDTGPQGERGAIGPKGDKGEKGDKGDDYTLTEVDKKEIAVMVDVSDVDLSGVAPAIKNTISGGEKSLTINDVSPLEHKCSLRLTNDVVESRNIYEFDSENMIINFDEDTLSKTYNDNGTLTLNGYTNSGISVEFYLRNLTVGETYTFSLKPYGVMFIEARNQNHEIIGEPINAENDVVTFTHTEDIDYYFVASNSFGAVEDAPFVNRTLYPQLELGTVATEWTQYGGNSYIEDFSTVKVNVNGKSYTPNTDGTVTDIESVSPTMEITTDNEHANICDFTYCVDTKKYVDNNSGGGVSSWNDLTDKPFYDEGTKTVTLDYANPPAVGIDLDGVFLGKVTDDILTDEYLNGANLSLSFTANGTVNNASQELNVDTLQVYPFPIGTAYQFECEADGTTFLVMMAVATQTGEVDLFGDGNLINIPETGTYMGCVPYGEATQNSISLEYNLIKTLEAKYLEVINKTANTVLLNEQEVSFEDDGNGTYQAMLGAIPLTAGKKYKVLWDGEEYVYEAIRNEEIIAIGDFIALNPFAIVVVEENTTVCATSDASTTHTISIIEVGGYEIKQEYLPASLYTEIDQRIENYINEALGGDY